MPFKTFVSLLIFCPDDVSIDETGVLKSPTIIVHYGHLPLWLLVFALHIKVLLCWVHIYL